MKLPARQTCLLSLFLLSAGTARSGQFRYGFLAGKQQHVTLQIARPPDALIEARSIQVKDKAGVAFPAMAALKLNIEQALNGDFTITATNPEATITYTITAYVPVTASRQVQNEKRQVVVGKETVKGLRGRPVEVDKYDDRVVPVEYWVTQGSATLQADVTDSSGTLLDTFSETANIESRTEIAVQGVAIRKRETQAPQTVDGAANELVRRLANLVKRRYTTTTDPTDALLAVDDELRNHNELAEAGAWEKALAAFNSVKMKKNPADRLYNMAVCHEAIAYAKYMRTRNAEDAKADFDQAMKLYVEAKALDPGEKYFGLAESRLQKAVASFAKVKELAELRSVRMAQLQAEAEAVAEEEKKKAAMEQERLQAQQLEKAALESKRADTADEADFRSLVRLRLRSHAGTPPGAVLQEMQQMGEKRFRLEPLASKRVVYQEERALADFRDRANEYREMFRAAAADKQVSTDERGTLDRIALRLDLDQQMVQSIEQEFPAVTPQPPRTAPSGNIPATPAAKKPAPPVRETRPVQVKPTPARPAAAPQPNPTPTPSIENTGKKK